MAKYPKWMYHPDIKRYPPGVIVHDQAQEDALGGAWYDHPEDFPEPPPPGEIIEGDPETRHAAVKNKKK